MKFYKQIIFILVIFLKTETLFSENKLFSDLILEQGFTSRQSKVVSIGLIEDFLWFYIMFSCSS